MRPLLLLLFCGIVGCASKQPQLPYPAFIQVDELPEIFIAGLPGVRARQLAGNPETRRSSTRIELPSGWNFTTGASPGKSVELFVLAGQISLNDLSLAAGSYAYIPPGSTGMQMATGAGALLLYFQDDPSNKAVIQTPLIRDSKLLGWQPVSDNPNDLGRSIKVLREDPGSGARTWLEKFDAHASLEWEQSSTTREGYLLSGSYHDVECVNGEVATGDYLPGGYFHRVPGAINGGPEAHSAGGAVWFVRVLDKETVQRLPACEPIAMGQ